ncbi:MAG: hypothetical protein CK551_07880, partial [Planctomycetaceae bacterium]
MIYIQTLVIGFFATLVHAADNPVIPPQVEGVLRTYCTKCHCENKSKGEVRLDNLDTQEPKVRINLMNKFQEQLFFQEMPPESEKQPNTAERKLLADWVRAELVKMNAPL